VTHTTLGPWALASIKAPDFLFFNYLRQIRDGLDGVHYRDPASQSIRRREEGEVKK
jgi:hypothetical protein